VKQWSLNEEGEINPEPVATLLGKVRSSLYMRLILYLCRHLVPEACVKFMINSLRKFTSEDIFGKKNQVHSGPTNLKICVQLA